jgi:ERCC4-related helicase
MTDEKSPDMENIKIRLGDEIPVEEDVEALKAEQEQSDIVDEFKDMGRQFGETLHSAWYSEERVRFEKEVREGVQSFTKEVNKVFGEVRESEAAAKAKKEASEVRSKINQSEATDKAKDGLAQGLHWFSQELEKLANQFTPASPVEKAPPAEDEPQD